MRVARLAVCAALLGSALVSGCGSLPPAPEAIVAAARRVPSEAFEMQGRLAVSDGQRAAHMVLFWQHKPGEDLISFDTPLGQTLAQLRIGVDSAVLQEAGGQRTVAASADELAARVVGVAIPVARLADWLQAVAGPGASVQRVDRFGRPMVLAEQQWLVRYPEYASASPAAMPRRVEAEWGDISVRVVIDEWRGQ